MLGLEARVAVNLQKIMKKQRTSSKVVLKSAKQFLEHTACIQLPPKSIHAGTNESNLRLGHIETFFNFKNLLNKGWRNLIIIPSFQYYEHALESYCHCASFSVYVSHLKRKQQ